MIPKSHKNPRITWEIRDLQRGQTRLVRLVTEIDPDGWFQPSEWANAPLSAKKGDLLQTYRGYEKRDGMERRRIVTGVIVHIPQHFTREKYAASSVWQ